MASLYHIETIEAPFALLGADIHDLILGVDNGDLTLSVVAGENINTRIVTFDLDGTLTLEGTQYLGISSGSFVGAEFGGVTLQLSNSLLNPQLSPTEGTTGTAVSLSDLNSGFEGDSVSVLGVSSGGVDYILATPPSGGGLAIDEITGPTSFNPFNTTSQADVGTISDITSFAAFDQTWIIASSSEDHSVSSYTISDTGALEHQHYIGAVHELGLATPMVVRTVMLDDQPYVLTASADSFSISVLTLEADGSFSASDHILDDLNTRFDGVSSMETITIGDAAFVAVAGGDDGLSIFRLRPDGKLFHVASIADETDTALTNVNALELASIDGDLHVLASSSVDTGLSHFSLDLGALGTTLSGSDGNDVLTGASLDDMILGRDGNDVLLGGDGDDILVDGAGSDTLTGGSGADTFVLDDDGETDVINDFHSGQDQLDLSGWSLLYDLDDAIVTSTVTGARITFFDEILIINSHDGNSLTLADLELKNPFNVDRPPLILNIDQDPDDGYFLGTSGEDHLIGGADNETLSGGIGNDRLTGGAGADILYGGGGRDTADYSTSTSGVRVDLTDADSNTGDALGDVLSSIEDISGSNFVDYLLGNNYKISCLAATATTSCLAEEIVIICPAATATIS